MLEKQNDTITFAESVARGMDVLQYIVDRLAPAGILHFIPDLITVQAARIGVFLVKASHPRVPVSTMCMSIVLCACPSYSICLTAQIAPGSSRRVCAQRHFALVPLTRRRLRCGCEGRGHCIVSSQVLHRPARLAASFRERTIVGSAPWRRVRSELRAGPLHKSCLERSVGRTEGAEQSQGLVDYPAPEWTAVEDVLQDANHW
jgi:hypothetical protein